MSRRGAIGRGRRVGPRCCGAMRTRRGRGRGRRSRRSRSRTGRTARSSVCCAGSRRSQRRIGSGRRGAACRTVYNACDDHSCSEDRADLAGVISGRDATERFCDASAQVATGPSCLQEVAGRCWRAVGKSVHFGRMQALGQRDVVSLGVDPIRARRDLDDVPAASGRSEATLTHPRRRSTVGISLS